MSELTIEIKKRFDTMLDLHRKELDRGHQIVSLHNPLVKSWPQRHKNFLSSIATFAKTCKSMLEKITSPFDLIRFEKLEEEKKRTARIRYLSWIHWRVWSIRLEFVLLSILYLLGLILSAMVKMIKYMANFIKKHYILIILSLVIILISEYMAS